MRRAQCAEGHAPPLLLTLRHSTYWHSAQSGCGGGVEGKRGKERETRQPSSSSESVGQARSVGSGLLNPQPSLSTLRLVYSGDPQPSPSAASPLVPQTIILVLGSVKHSCGLTRRGRGGWAWPGRLLRARPSLNHLNRGGGAWPGRLF